MPEKAEKPEKTEKSKSSAEAAQPEPRSGTQHPTPKELTRAELEALRQELQRRFHG